MAGKKKGARQGGKEKEKGGEKEWRGKGASPRVFLGEGSLQFASALEPHIMRACVCNASSGLTKCY